MGRRCVPDFSELDLLSATLRSAMGFLLLAASSLANRPAGDVGEERRDIPRDGRSGGQVQSRGEEEGGKRLRVREVRLLVRNPEPRNLQVVTVTHPYRHIKCTHSHTCAHTRHKPRLRRYRCYTGPLVEAW